MPYATIFHTLRANVRDVEQLEDLPPGSTEVHMVAASAHPVQDFAPLAQSHQMIVEVRSRMLPPDNEQSPGYKIEQRKEVAVFIEVAAQSADVTRPLSAVMAT